MCPLATAFEPLYVQVRMVQARCGSKDQVSQIIGTTTKLCPFSLAFLRLAACFTNLRPKDFFPWASLGCSSGLVLYCLNLAWATVFKVIFLRLCLVLQWCVTALVWAVLPRKDNPSKQTGHVQFLCSKGKLEVSTSGLCPIRVSDLEPSRSGW